MTTDLIDDPADLATYHGLPRPADALHIRNLLARRFPDTSAEAGS